jgi:flagellar biosynthetic protein FlhB
MAEEAEDDASKTEEPTAKRLQDAREKGQVVASREINHWMLFSGATLAAVFLGASMWQNLSRSIRPFIDRPHEFSFEGAGLQRVIASALIDPMVAILPLLAILMVAALAAQLLQNGLLFSAESLVPKFSKISPVAGFKRLFSSHSVVEFVKGLLKISIVGIVCWYALEGEIGNVSRFIDMEPIVSVIAVMTLIAGGDYFYQRFQHYKRLRMSKQEIKDEYKQSEGDPVVKGRIKQLRMERARRRMMSAIPKATVVVTNPTHFAVALQYDEDTPAPICVAKGSDLVALKIRELAAEHKVPVVENKPLARALFATVEIDSEIPQEHYKAVAEVITYVLSLKRRLAPKTAPANAPR